MLALHPPVEAPISRPFHYEGSPFQRGLHRGVDFAAPPGTPVERPCGHLVYRGPRARTFACGRYRVTLLPLRDGRTTTEPLHLGVRRATDPFGYIDPAPLLTRTPSMPRSPAPAPGPRRITLRPAPPRVAPAPARAPDRAPTLAWTALAIAATATAGGARLRVRLRRRAGAAPSTQEA